MVWYDWHDHVPCDTITHDVAWLRYDHIRCDTIAFDVIRPRRCDTITCDVIRLWNEQLTMWCDYGDVTVDCSTTLARLGNDTNATTLEIACPKLNAVIEERWWNRRAWNVLIPRFPTFFLVCSEEEDSLWIELFPILSGREFYSNFMLLRWLCNGYTNSRETTGGYTVKHCHATAVLVTQSPIM